MRIQKIGLRTKRTEMYICQEGKFYCRFLTVIRNSSNPFSRIPSRISAKGNGPCRAELTWPSVKNMLGI
jgi:hypothetical protein